MATKSSIHIKPCNIASSEAHNRRTAEYMRHIGESRIYVVSELSTDNEQWINPDFGSPDLRTHYDNIRQMVKEKTGRAMQEKERERKGKNGKIVKIAGCSPIREGVLLVRSDTTLADVRKFGEECQKRWGITPLQIFLHKDVRKIIQELQLCRYGYEDYIASLFNDILLLVDHQQHEQKKATGNVQEQIEYAAAYFNENYNTKISIDDYAESLHISTNWFIHNFKQYAGMSPAQYILSLRMVNAQSLLERTTYNIKDISEIVGYENPLYFSRVFKKEIGKSPAQYRKEMIPTEAV